MILALVAPAAAQQKPLTLTVEVPEAQTLLNSLADGKWKDVNPLMQKLISQVNEQMKPKPAEPEKKKEEKPAEPPAAPPVPPPINNPSEN